LALVNSKVFGESLKDFFKLNGLKLNYILKNKASSRIIRSKTVKADVIITVCGCPNLIKSDMIKNEAILIDAGIKRRKDGKVAGDIDKSVNKKASFITPIVGGIGPLTVSLLLKNVYLAAKKYGRI
jgi:methylenetetrahydrofolate dehydrogenase (NADP+)/methenyltetrahydrofolate cyclohydrolase